MQTTPHDRKSVFIVNLEKIVGDGPATGNIAAKNISLMPRYLWYLDHFDTVVLESLPPSDFQDYVSSFGLAINVYVPPQLHASSLTMLDAFDDPKFVGIVSGSNVDSYVPDAALAELVHAHGGTYLSSADNRANHLAGDKHHFSEISAPLFITPPGELQRGIYHTAKAVLARLKSRQDTFVRITRAGGGLGNHVFYTDDWPKPTEAAIARELGGKNPQLWRGATALVEDVIDLTSTYGVAFHTLGTLHHTTLQITRGNNFCGCWIPCPPEICPPSSIENVVAHFSKQLSNLGFHGHAQTDLGIDTQGNHYGFEVNARYTGGMHAKFIMDLLGAPVAKSIDTFYLADDFSFIQLKTKLSAANLLASPNQPTGAVISIPPVGGTTGIVVLGPTHQDVDTLYYQIVDCVGDPTKNSEDRPLYPLNHN